MAMQMRDGVKKFDEEGRAKRMGCLKRDRARDMFSGKEGTPECFWVG